MHRAASARPPSRLRSCMMRRSERPSRRSCGCHSDADLGELFDKICANSYKGRGTTIVVNVLMPRTNDTQFAVHIHCPDDSFGTYKFNKAFKLREYGLEFKEAYDLPRKMEPGVGLVPVHDAPQPGWWGIRGKMDIPRFINGLRQLSELDFFTAKFSFKFVEVRTPKSAAIALLDAIRYRAGLMDMIDFSMDNSNDENGTRITSTNSSKRPRGTPIAMAR